MENQDKAFLDDFKNRPIELITDDDLQRASAMLNISGNLQAPIPGHQVLYIVEDEEE